jgi:predicted hydrocarbon binding protein
MSLTIDHTFDQETYRHSINGHEFVLHCHHYMTLTTKMAEDFRDLGAVQALRESTEDSIRPVLDSYYAEHGVTSAEERLAVGAEYYAFMGMGLMDVSGATATGQIKLKHSHVDEGWIKKWGNHSKPVNHFTCGFVAALFGAAFSKPVRSYQVSEMQSIVMGAPESVLTVKLA